LLADAARRLKKGLLIAIEGIDGAGKTTQARILMERLVREGYSVTLLKEPTNSKWGQEIRNLAKNGRHKVTPQTEFEFFLYDRVEDVEKNIKPALNRKDIVIMDRYYISNVAYQGARSLDLDFIEKENLKFAPKPDLAIILDLPPHVALSRIRSRDSAPNHFEREKYLKEVREIFLRRFEKRPYISIVNGQPPIETVESEIWNVIRPIIQSYEEPQ
jgi:dTMP kinase